MQLHVCAEKILEPDLDPLLVCCHSERSPFDSLRSLRINSAESRNLSLLPPKAGATNAHRPFWGSSRPGPLKNSRSGIAGLRLFLIDDST